MKEIFSPMLEEIATTEDSGGSDHELCSIGFICVPGGGMIVLGLIAHL